MCGICGCSEEVTTQATSRQSLLNYIGHTQPRSGMALLQPLLPGQEVPISGDTTALLSAAGSPAESTRLIQVERSIQDKNNHFAKRNREYFQHNHIAVLNLLSSPGSGKTTLLVKTLTQLKQQIEMFVIEGDQQTQIDADRIRATGAAVLQVNTGKGCHLDAAQVGTACAALAPSPKSILFIENVGNLVCPAAFDLGEQVRVVMLSVTEGEDKPLKYPDIFETADIVLLNKCDLLPYLEFDRAQCLAAIEAVNPRAQVIWMSATSGLGLSQWYDFLEGISRV